MRLLAAVIAAHQEAARRNDNASSQMMRALSWLGVSFDQAITGAIQTLGGFHGPITQARRLLYSFPEEDIARLLRERKRIPGWGNSFHKDGIDPCWKPVADIVATDHPDDWKRVATVSRILHRSGYELYPNAACFTAIAAERLELAPGTELSLFIQGRLPVWVELWAESRPQTEVAQCL